MWRGLAEFFEDVCQCVAHSVSGFPIAWNSARCVCGVEALCCQSVGTGELRASISFGNGGASCVDPIQVEALGLRSLACVTVSRALSPSWD